MIEKLTDEEKELLDQYRKLSPYEQGYISGVLEAEIKRIRNEKRKGFHAAGDQPGGDDPNGLDSFLRDFKPR